MANGRLFAQDDDEIDIDAAAPEQDVAPASLNAEELTPRTMPDLLGHEEVEKALLADFNAGRFPHAVIFAGPSGIGKATLAFRLARFLLAHGGAQEAGLFGEPEKPDTLHVAPEHPVFRRVASGGHADLVVVEREMDEKKGRLKNDISVESVRRITPFLRKTAAEGGWRVVIVDGAEHLNHSSQNALLKILEEPPKKTLLALTTAQPGAFLPTIRSRCRMVQMHPLEDGIVAALLDKLAPPMPLAQKTDICRFAEGSIGRAVQFHAAGGVELYKTLLALVETLPDMSISAVHDMAEKVARGGAADDTYDAARDILTGWCQRTARMQARGHALTDVMAGDADVFNHIIARYPPHHFLHAGEKISLLFQQTEQYNLDKRQALIGAFLALQQQDYQGLSV